MHILSFFPLSFYLLAVDSFRLLCMSMRLAFSCYVFLSPSLFLHFILSLSLALHGLCPFFVCCGPKGKCNLMNIPAENWMWIRFGHDYFFLDTHTTNCNNDETHFYVSFVTLLVSSFNLMDETFLSFSFYYIHFFLASQTFFCPSVKRMHLTGRLFKQLFTMMSCINIFL